LGSTGSIGVQTLDIIRRNPERFRIASLVAHSRWQMLAEQAREFRAESVVIGNKEYYPQLKAALKDTDIKVLAGDQEINHVAQSYRSDTLVNALVGYAGLHPTALAIESGKRIALANKETLVAAGSIVTRLAREYNSPILPVDSEHSAIFQCLQGEHTQIEKLILTASGGPFRTWSREDIAKATREQALKHPNWDMGAKVTIDSASMMNKGLEMIEASWLFNVSPDDIEIVVHPQSIVHSMVQFTDGCLKAQLGAPDMRVPIQYALSYPQRVDLDTQRISFPELAHLDFYAPDTTRFPAIELAYSAHRVGGNMACIMNGANEVAVDAFLKDRILFSRIPEIIEKTMEKATFVPLPDTDDIFASHAEAKEIATSLI
jgi:1-deoxy-D-xylulose-5-phosphate reductoisomerase